ncbi:hypothetical protein Tco_1099206 [Tanacetum coccineum]
MGSEKSKRTTFILINVGSIKDDLKWTYDMMSCLTQVHVVCAWVLDLYYGVHGFDSFTGGAAAECSRILGLTTCKDDLKWTYDMMSCLTQVHVVCARVLDLYYGVHGFDSFTGGLFMAV